MREPSLSDLLAQAREENEKLRDLMGKLRSDYDHAWPAEDQSTRLHRLYILSEINNLAHPNP